MSLFQFHNEFDDVTVILDDESTDMNTHGPFSVRVDLGMWADRETTPPKEVETFATLGEAMVRFNELVKNEVRAVLDDGTF